MNRPYIICHMLTSIDGKVTGDFLSKEASQKGCEIYYEKNRKYDADCFICGRVTMQESFTGSYYPDLSGFSNSKIELVDFINKSNINKYAVSFDRFGRVGWVSSKIVDEDPGYNNRNIIEVVTQKAPSNYLRYLQSIGVSYIFAGEDDIDIKKALHKLYELFNIKFALLEGGSIINGAFFKEDVVDEISLVVVPVIAEACDKPLFMNSTNQSYELKECTQIDNNIYLNYIKHEK